MVHAWTASQMREDVSDPTTGRNLLRHWPIADVDRQIIAHLQDDGRRSFVTIAHDIGVTEKTVRNRVRQLLASNVIQIVALTNPSALGYHAGALVALTTDPAHPASQIASELTKIDEVDYVVVTTGRYNIFAEVICIDASAMQTCVEQKIGRVAGVRSVEIFPYFSLYYQQARFFVKDEHARSTARAVVDKALDETDKAIAQELSYDGRTALKTVGDKLGISETQVRTRIQSMLASGTMDILAIVNPMNLKNRSIAWVAIRCTNELSPRAIADELAKISYVHYLAICSGRFNMFVEFVCPSNDELFDVLDQKVRPMKGVAYAEAFLYLDLHYKRLTPFRVAPSS
jgi:DNA-binding Lrp family transcriptional regulator